MSQNQIVTIDLLNSSNAKEFSQINFIHQNEFDTVNGWIQERIDNIQEDKRERLHETITILGTRGSGKTSFLLTLLDKYRKSEIQVIDIIDPTLIEQKGHVFLNIIALVKRLVDDRMNQRECDPTSQDYLKKSIWEDKLQKLANGLPSIDGVGSGLTEPSWQDPEYIMRKGIIAVSSAQDLEKNFHNLIDEALVILEKKAFLIAFDDIDIDFSRGWPVLETIRKYLTTSKIITLISGDLKLYSIAVKNNLAKSFHGSNGTGPAKSVYFDEILTEMEGQYLQKVIKPERRIHLNTLNEKQSYNGDLNVDVQSGKRTINIVAFYREIFSSFGIINRYQARSYLSFSLSLPLRTQIRFLSVFRDDNDRKIDGNRLIQAFISDFYEKQINISQIQSTPYLLNIAILRLLIREQFLSEGYQLQPTSDNVSLNASLMALSFLFSNQVSNNNPDRIFDYLIKIGYTRNLLTALDYSALEGKPESILAPSIEGLCRRTGIYQDGVLRDIVGNMTAYIRGYLNFKKKELVTWAGTIPILGLAETLKASEGEVANRIDRIFKDRTTDERTLAYIPLSLSKYSFKSGRIACYSIFSLIATIGELIRKTQDDDIKKGLLELSQLRTYSMPEFSDLSAEVEDNYESKENGVSSKESEGEMWLASSIERWRESFRHDNPVSPHLLGKISTRLFYAVDNIQPKRSSNLGTVFHAHIVSFMNAILIEDVRENLEYIDININNSNYSDRIFINNLNKISRSQEQEHLAFSRWMLSCPLLLGYLNPDSDMLLDSLHHFCRTEQFNHRTELSVYSLLERVPLRVGNNRVNFVNTEIYTFEQLFILLKDRGVPFDLFKETDGAIRIHNKEIVKLLPDIFGRNSSKKISEFRKYLKDNNLSW